MKTITWCYRLFKSIHKTRLKTLGILIDALIQGSQLGVCALGRSIRSGTTIKHKIKQIDRFLSNENVKVEEFLSLFFPVVCGSRKRVTIAVDCTNVKERVVFCAAVVEQGRCLPVYWRIVEDTALYCHNTEEERFFEGLSDLIPDDYEVIILADRGFHRSPLTEKLKSLGFYYVIRQPCVPLVYSEKYKGRLRDLPLRMGKVVDLGKCILTRVRRYTTRVVALRDFKQKQTWYVSTNLYDLDPSKIVKLYSIRFRIEETFRDVKGVRGGWHLKRIGIKSVKRLSRLLLIAVVTYFFLSLMGIAAERQGIHKGLVQCTSKRRVISLFQVGKLTFYNLRIGLPGLLSLLKYLIVDVT